VATQVIPPEFSDALKAFVLLEDQVAAKFVQAIESAAPTLLVSTLAEKVAGISGLEKGQARDFLMMFGSMSRSRSSSEKNVESFLKSVRQSAIDAGVISANEMEAHWPKAAKHLAAVLNAPAIQIAAKALAVMTSNERMLCTARVVSDIRPIFSDDLEPTACVILHQLKLSFHEQGDYDNVAETFVAVDYDHLRTLQKAIDRALKKHGKLKAMAAAMNLRVLSPEE